MYQLLRSTHDGPLSLPSVTTGQPVLMRIRYALPCYEDVELNIDKLALGSYKTLAYRRWSNGFAECNDIFMANRLEATILGVYSCRYLHRLLLAAIAFLQGNVLAQTNCTPPPSDLVSWWRGESNALDQVSGNNGSLVGNATYAADEVGIGFTFNGAGDAVQIGNPPDLQLQNFTIEGWIQRASTTFASQNDPNNGAIFACTWVAMESGYGTTAGCS